MRQDRLRAALHEVAVNARRQLDSIKLAELTRPAVKTSA